MFGGALVEVQVKLVASLLQVHNHKDANFPNKKNPIVDIFRSLWLDMAALQRNLSFAFKWLCSPSHCSHSIIPPSLLQRTAADKKTALTFQGTQPTKPCVATECRASYHLVSNLHGCKSSCTMQLSYVQGFSLKFLSDPKGEAETS